MSSHFCFSALRSWNFYRTFDSGEAGCSEFLRVYCASKHRCFITVCRAYTRSTHLWIAHIALYLLFEVKMKLKWGRLSLRQLCACLLCAITCELFVTWRTVAGNKVIILFWTLKLICNQNHWSALAKPVGTVTRERETCRKVAWYNVKMY